MTPTQYRTILNQWHRADVVDSAPWLECTMTSGNAVTGRATTSGSIFEPDNYMVVLEGAAGETLYLDLQKVEVIKIVSSPHTDHPH